MMLQNPSPPQPADAAKRGRQAESLLADLFKEAGWRVVPEPKGSQRRADLVIRRQGVAYAIEVKAAAEGRSDRLVPLWAQACLEAQRSAGDKRAPLAVVAAPRIAPRVAEQIVRFAQEYAPDAAAGVIDFEGLRLFRGPHLEELNAEPRRAPFLEHRPNAQPQVFSDLNQWMLKVLLAPELPDSLLSAPRGRYRNASQLAAAANVSVMSAFRFVQQLQREGYLHESDPYLELVRREHLFQRWQAAPAASSVQEIPMRFRLRGKPQDELRPILQSGLACLALFAAAEALGLGFVQGIPPYVYVQRLQPANVSAWKNIAPAGPGEQPDLILRRAPALQSVFRGIVRPQGMAACDVIQVWLDVSGHAARGPEQADIIRKRVLGRLIGGKHSHG
jgi:hypothetical protein